MAKKRGEERRRRASGEGTIGQRKDGRWQARISLGGLKRKSFYGKTQQEVLAKLTEERSKLQKGIPIVTERHTLNDFLEIWLEQVVKPRIREQGFLSYRQQVRLHIAPALGRYPVDEAHASAH